MTHQPGTGAWYTMGVRSPQGLIPLLLCARLVLRLPSLPPATCRCPTGCDPFPSPGPEQPYPVDELADHARPGAVGLGCPVQPVLHQPQAVAEAQQLSQLPQHVHAEALKALISRQGLEVGPAHDVWVFLERQGRRGVRVRRLGAASGS